MKLKEFLQEHFAFLVMNGCAFFLVAAILSVQDVRFLTIFVLFFIWFLPLLSYMAMQFCREKRFLDELDSLSQSLDQAYLLSEVITPPAYAEGQVYYRALKRANRSMLERVNEYAAAQKEYQEYVETWVHEIKTPIASAQLIIDNHKDDVTRAINAELRQIDDYVEQALYYAKSNTVNTDYQVRPCDLAQLTKDAITRNASDLIRKNFSVEVSQACGIVYTDSKWIAFILNQLIGNALKYCREEERKLQISSQMEKNCTVLSVWDNGIGIPVQDQAKVFEKGFTGENGRHFGKSTGIGLYLCKKLCGCLGIGITLESEVGKGTSVHLIFPIGELHSAVKGSR